MVNILPPEYRFRALWTGILSAVAVGVALSNDLPTASTDVPASVCFAAIAAWGLWPVRLATGDALVRTVLRRSRRRLVAIALVMLFVGIPFALIPVTGGRDAWPYIVFLAVPATLGLSVGAVISLHRAFRWDDRASYLLEVLSADPRQIVRLEVTRLRTPGVTSALTSSPDRNIVGFEVVFRNGRSIELGGTPFENRDLFGLLTERCSYAELLDPLGPRPDPGDD